MNKQFSFPGVYEAEWEDEVTSNREQIKWVQQALNQIMGLRLTVDGVAGAQTRSAIRSFQARQGLAADGVVGPRTETALKAALGSSASRITSPTGGASPTSCAGLRQPEILDQFEFNKDALLAIHTQTLERIAGCISASQNSSQPVRSIRIVGHTDPVGSASYNLDLGRRRAERTRAQLTNVLNRLKPALAGKIVFTVESLGESRPISSSAAKNRRVEIFVSGGKAEAMAELTAQEKAKFAQLSIENQARFAELRRTIEKYTGVAKREADRGSRILLSRGVFQALPQLLGEIINLTKITRLPSGWSLPLLVGNVLYNLAFPETINQGGTDRLGGSADPTCYSASTQILLARRFPVTYVRLTIQLATTSKATFAGGDSVGPLPFVSTSLYKSLDSVLIQTAVDFMYGDKARAVGYRVSELKVQQQVFGKRAPRYATHDTKSNIIRAFRKAFTNGGDTRPWEMIILSTLAGGGGLHAVVLTRVKNNRVYFYNPWANEEEKNTMFGRGRVSVSGNGEFPGESSMSQSDFEGQLENVLHN